jgi:transcriptional regulator with XRE-family HTH domain
MPRPPKHPVLDPREPTRSLALSMRNQRKAHGWSAKRLAEAYGCHPSMITRAEHGQTRPSRMLVLFYEEVFEARGLLMSEFEVALTAAEQERRRWRGRRPRLHRASPGDASEFIGDTVPHGTLMKPGQIFQKSWTIRNAGTVAWTERRLERQGPITGPGLITSERFIPMPPAQPGATIEITTTLRAPTYDCASIAYFKQVAANGHLCFPDNYQLGLDVLVLVRGQKPDNPPLMNLTEDA